MNVIINESLYDNEFVIIIQRVSPHCQREFKSIRWTRVEDITGVDRNRPSGSLPLSMLTVKLSFIYAGSGMQHHTNGGMTIRTISSLPGLTGAWKYPGGGNVLSYQRSVSD
jgi:anaerobic selenocysteine-containing dehydrogenase